MPFPTKVSMAPQSMCTLRTDFYQYIILCVGKPDSDFSFENLVWNRFGTLNPDSMKEPLVAHMMT